MGFRVLHNEEFKSPGVGSGALGWFRAQGAKLSRGFGGFRFSLDTANNQ